MGTLSIRLKRHVEIFNELGKQIGCLTIKSREYPRQSSLKIVPLGVREDHEPVPSLFAIPGFSSD